MTLAEALDALHEQGKIKAPWLPGMLDQTGRRLTLRDPDGGRHWALVVGEGQPAPGLHEPDTTDAATVGCLTALLREATGDRCAFASPTEFFQGREYSGPWLARWAHPIEGFSDGPDSPTEGAALANALITLAGGTP